MITGCTTSSSPPRWRGIVAERPPPHNPGRPAFFRGPGGRLVGADDAAVHQEQVPVDLAVAHPAGLEVAEDAVPQALAGPVAEAVVDGLPGAEAVGQVAPAAAVGQRPEDAVEHQPVVLPLAAAPAVRGEQALELL